MNCYIKLNQKEIMKPEPTKLIGHEVCVAIKDGEIIESGIVHKYNKADGQPAGSINTAQAGPYVQTKNSVVQGYVRDEGATFNFLEDNEVRYRWGDRIMRPARPYERGQVLTGRDFRAPNTRPGGWSYDEIQPGQCLWVEVEEVRTAESVMDRDLEKVVDNVTG